MFIRITIASLVLALALVQVPQALSEQPFKIKVTWTSASDDALYVMIDRPQILKNHAKVYTVEWFKFRSPAEREKAMIAGLVDAETADLLGLARAIVKTGLDIKIVAQVIGERPGYFSSTYAALKKSGIATLKDVKGKTIAVPSYGDTIDLILRHLLTQAGLDPTKDVKIVEVPFALHGQALERGQVDVAFLPQPFYSVASKKLELVDVARFQDALPRQEILVFLFATKFFNQNPEIVKAFMEDYLIARRWITDHKEEAMESAARVSKVPKELMAPYYFTKDDYYRDPEAVPDLQVVQETLDFLYKIKGIDRRLEATTLVDLKYHPAAKK